MTYIIKFNECILKRGTSTPIANHFTTINFPKSRKNNLKVLQRDGKSLYEIIYEIFCKLYKIYFRNLRVKKNKKI